jgi:4-amino-4-deoxy-L-arabinose transferase-like glycosyltransferase
LRSTPTVARAALSVFTLALTVRVIHLWELRHSPFFSTLMGDARAYDEWAQRLAGGDWIGTEVFYQAPLYPYFLGSVYAVFGRDLWIVRLIQAALGAGSCALLVLTGARLFSVRVGATAGAILALYAPAVFLDGLIQKSVLDVFLTCLSLWLVAELIVNSNRRGLLIALVFALVLLILIRVYALLLEVVVFVWAFLIDRL